MSDTLLILGASVRAAAFSALRGGYRPAGGDIFADADLARRCSAWRAKRYPDDLEHIALSSDRGAWMYTGSLENYPELIDRIASRRPLYGNAGEALRGVRDPSMVRSALAGDSILTPEVAMSPCEVPVDGSWLRKPLRGGAGGGIEVFRGSDSPTGATGKNDGGAHRGYYYQERIEGAPISAVYVAAGGRSLLLGASRQLMGGEWTGAGDADFRYAGSVGPLELDATTAEAIRAIGDCLSRRFDLLGLFGVDTVLNARGAWPVEVNPRYTASVEMLERALEFAAIRLHVEACRDGRLPETVVSDGHLGNKRFGKAILYARRELTVSHQAARQALSAVIGKTWPPLADIPNAGCRIPAGGPVLTVFAQAASIAGVQRKLLERLQEARRLVLG